MSLKNTERFSDRVENYVRYRPHYPVAIIPYLQTVMGFNNKWVVADIGSGTGISSELFLKNGNRVYGVEPNAEMRTAAEQLLNFGDFKSVNGTAEDTTLAASSVNLVLAGQAFHWFDRAKAKDEFKRIAVPGAYLLLMWNQRKTGSPFQKLYDEMLLEFAPAYAEVNHRNIDDKSIENYFAPFECTIKVLPNVQQFDFEGLKGRLLSSSYAPLLGPNHLAMLERLKQIFEQFNRNGLVEFEYDCQLYSGLIKN